MTSGIDQKTLGVIINYIGPHSLYTYNLCLTSFKHNEYCKSHININLYISIIIVFKDSAIR